MKLIGLPIRSKVHISLGLQGQIVVAVVGRAHGAALLQGKCRRKWGSR